MRRTAYSMPEAWARRSKGEEGRIVEGHSGVQASVVVSIHGMSDAPSRDVTVPESEWEEFELLG
jgi:hypothetical protein